jgi:hypothetical protein
MTGNCVAMSFSTSSSLLPRRASSCGPPRPCREQKSTAVGLGSSSEPPPPPPPPRSSCRCCCQNKNCAATTCCRVSSFHTSRFSSHDANSRSYCARERGAVGREGEKWAMRRERRARASLAPRAAAVLAASESSPHLDVDEQPARRRAAASSAHGLKRSRENHFGRRPHERGQASAAAAATATATAAAKGASAAREHVGLFGVKVAEGRVHHGHVRPWRCAIPTVAAAGEHGVAAACGRPHQPLEPRLCRRAHAVVVGRERRG